MKMSNNKKCKICKNMCSVIYCEKCDKYVDTDIDAEHFEEHEEIKLTDQMEMNGKGEWR